MCVWAREIQTEDLLHAILPSLKRGVVGISDCQSASLESVATFLVHKPSLVLSIHSYTVTFWRVRKIHSGPS